MGRFFFFISEGFRAMRRNGAPSIAAIVTVAITMLLLGVLVPVLETTGGKAEEVRDQVGLRVFLYDDATQAEIDALGSRLEKLAHVQSVDYVDKQEALASLKEKLSDSENNPISALNGRNPLPRSFEIQPDDIDNLETIGSALSPPNIEGKREPISPIIEEVRDNREDVAPLRSVTGFLKWFLIVIAALLIIASLLLVANTIRLSIYSRRREVEVMRLVGATNWFIRWPFMVEGLACGFIGGVIAIGVLFLGKVTIVDPLADTINLISAQQTIAFAKLTVILLAVAMMVSALGSGFTLRRFLRV